MKTRRFLKALGVIGITASAAIAPQLLPVARKEESDDESRRAFDDSDIIGASDGKMQGDYVALRSLDKYISLYTWMTDMVNTESSDGMFWTKVRFVDEGNNVLSLYGTRNDGREFVVRTPSVEQQVGETGNNARIVDTAFDCLRKQLNAFLCLESGGVADASGPTE